MRNQMAMAPQILAQGQQRLQGVHAQFEPRFMERSVPEFTVKPKTVALAHVENLMLLCYVCTINTFKQRIYFTYPHSSKLSNLI